MWTDGLTDGHASKTVYPPVSLCSLGGYKHNSTTKILLGIANTYTQLYLHQTVLYATAATDANRNQMDELVNCADTVPHAENNPIISSVDSTKMISKISIKNSTIAQMHFYTNLSNICVNLKMSCSRIEQLSRSKQLLKIFVDLRDKIAACERS